MLEIKIMFQCIFNDGNSVVEKYAYPHVNEYWYHWTRHDKKVKHRLCHAVRQLEISYSVSHLRVVALFVFQPG